MVSEIQGKCVLPEAVPIGIRDFDDLIQNATEPKPVDETTPCFRNIHISNLTCSNARRAFFFNGIPEMPIKDITLENVYITSQLGGEFVYSEDISLKNIQILPKEGKDITTRFCKNIKR